MEFLPKRDLEPSNLEIWPRDASIEVSFEEVKKVIEISTSIAACRSDFSCLTSTSGQLRTHTVKTAAL